MKFLSLIIFFAFNGHAAVPPNVLEADLRFSISERGTTWETVPAPPDSNSIKVLFRSPTSQKNTSATFTVRTEKLEHGEKDLKEYAKRWLKEYPKFGYNVLGQKPFSLDGRAALVVDLVSTNTGKQARQVLSERDKTVVLLTCLDNQTSFNESLASCNTIIKNFKWK